jgi:hypothetical protein
MAIIEGPDAGDRRPLWQRLLWFVGLWLVGIVTVGTLAAILKLWLL